MRFSASNTVLARRCGTNPPKDAGDSLGCANILQRNKGNKGDYEHNR